MSAPQAILVVDDEADIRRGVGALLKGAGYEVVTAADGQEALDSLAEFGVMDLIILDVMMPRMDGFQTLLQLRSSPNKDTPVILLTARSSPGAIGLGYSKGADIYITKPFEPSNLLKAVRFLIGAMSVREREELETDLLNAEETYLGIEETQEN